MTTVYASCSSYVLGSLFGPPKACELINEAVQHPAKKPPIFAVKALHALTRLADVTLAVDGGASHIGKSRSRHFHAALQSECEVWLTIDDDVSATPETMAWLLACVDVRTPCVCVAPCIMRGDGTVNVEWSPIYFERTLFPAGGSARRIIRGGFGLVAMNRAAMLEVAKASPSWKDPHDGHMKPAPFLESLDERGEWYGEDTSFFNRLPREVERMALTSGKTLHHGYELALDLLHGS